MSFGIFANKIKKAAMFGLDARVVLATVGVMALVGGDFTIKTVQSAQSTSLLMDLREVGHAAQKFQADRGENLDSVNTANELGTARKKVSQLVEEEAGKPWRGKYIDYDVDTSQADREFLISDKYTGIELINLRPDTIWKNETETANSICSSSTSCALWAKAVNVKKTTAKTALEKVNGSEVIFDTGNARWDESTGNFYYNLDSQELDLSGFSLGGSDGTWIAEPWGPCSVDCGSGTQSRTVYCNEASCSGVKPAETQSCNDQACAQWETGAWSPCSQECDTGIQTRWVVCDGRGCTGPRPANSQKCNTQQCGLGSWVLGDWSACSEACGGGTQTRTVTCSDEVCNGFRPATEQACNTDPCGTWVTGAWGACTEACGGGTQTRSVTCSETLCPGVEPANSQACNVDPCGVWIVGAWGSCNTGCDTEMRTRSVTCSETTCLDAEPISAEPCGSYTCEDPAVCTAPYYEDGDLCRKDEECKYETTDPKTYASRGSCSYNYEQGTVTCSLVAYWEGNTIYAASKKSYNDSIKPTFSAANLSPYTLGPAVTSSSWEMCSPADTTERCNAGLTYIGGKCVPPYTEGTWVTGAWGACSEACGTDGIKTRTVTCDADVCLDPEPASTQICHEGPCGTWIADTWGACSDLCGGGTQSMNYTCSEAVCLDPMPTDTQACNTDPCGTWSTGTWGACSVACGDGTQTRSVTCSEAVCLDAEPASTQACNDGPCSGYWIVGNWGACSSICEPATQTRSVTCSEAECFDTKPATSQSCGISECVSESCSSPYTVDNGSICTNPNPVCYYQTTSPRRYVLQGYTYYWDDATVYTGPSTTFGDYSVGTKKYDGMGSDRWQICLNNQSVDKCPFGHDYSAADDKCYPVELNNCGVPGCVYPSACTSPYTIESGAVCINPDPICYYQTTSPIRYVLQGYTYYWDGATVYTGTSTTSGEYSVGVKRYDGMGSDRWEICKINETISRCPENFTYDNATEMCLPD